MSDFSSMQCSHINIRAGGRNQYLLLSCESLGGHICFNVVKMKSGRCRRQGKNGFWSSLLISSNCIGGEVFGYFCGLEHEYGRVEAE